MTNIKDFVISALIFEKGGLKCLADDSVLYRKRFTEKECGWHQKANL